MMLSAILNKHYGITPTKITPLEGYDSVNFKIETLQATYILKQYDNTYEIAEDIAAENKMILLFSALPYEFPKPILNTHGNELSVHSKYLYRLLSYVDGVFLGDVNQTPELMSSFGTFLARCNKHMLGIKNHTIAARELAWDLQHFQMNSSLLSAISSVEDKRIVHYFFDQYTATIQPLHYNLRKCIIHNDANHWNILTKNDKISGIIDFGDMCYSYLINDLAIALSYVLMDKENPLEWIAPMVKAYHNIIPLEEKELSCVYYLVAARLCTSVCNAAHQKQVKPDVAYITISEQPAWDLLHKWLTINPLKVEAILRTACGYSPILKTSTEAALSARSTHLSSSLSLSYKRPIEMTRSALQYMYDAQGNTYLDAYNNIMIVGHSHPKVVAAGQRTLARLNTNTRYLYEELNTYAALLLKKFPNPLNKVFFVNSGSAASDLAIRLATTHTNREKIMVVEHGYHGNTRIGIDISHYKYNHKGGKGKKNNIIETVLPDTFNGTYKNNNGSAGKKYAAITNKKIQENAGEIACFIAEPIVGCGGQVPLAKAYLQHVYPAIRAQGGLCISDEVQVGFGRLGDTFWGFEMHEVEPDIVILGKPMGNGHPLAAVVTTDEIAASFHNGMEFFSSFGGNPVSCAIGKAVLETIEEEQLQRNAKEVGDYCKELFKNLQQVHHCIGDIRGSGLFLGVEIINAQKLPDTQLASKISNGLRAHHILISTDGPHNNVLKIKPPICFNKHNVETLVNTIELLLNSLQISNAINQKNTGD